jgi:opacity protein-like surface antigen
MRVQLKIKAALLALAVCASTSATDQLYAGVSMGKNTALIDCDRSASGAVSIDHSSLADNSPNAGFFIGYDHLITETPLFVGVEVIAQFVNLEITKKKDLMHAGTGTLKAELKNSFSGFLKLGVAIKDLLLYAKAGVTLPNFRSTFNNKEQNIVKNPKNPSPVFGFGIDYNLNKNWSLGVDHTFTKYTTFKFETTLGDMKLSPSLHTTNLRLIYRF